jgi:hypothetical protein
VRLLIGAFIPRVTEANQREKDMERKTARERTKEWKILGTEILL